MRVRGSVFAFVVALVLLPSVSSADTWPAWAMDQQPVTYCVNTSHIPIGSTGGPMMTGDELVAKVRAAFDTWTAVPGVNIKMTYAGLCSSDPTDHYDGVNAIGFAKLGTYSHEVAIGEVGPTYSHGRLSEMDLMLDTRFAQSFDDPHLYIDIALPNVLLHETGHFLGLQHTKTECSIMRPIIDDVQGGLCDYDRDQLRLLYPAP